MNREELQLKTESYLRGELVGRARRSCRSEPQSPNEKGGTVTLWGPPSNKLVCEGQATSDLTSELVELRGEAYSVFELSFLLQSF